MNNEISGSEKDYNFGQKRHWRKQSWNRIKHLLEKQGKLTQDSVVLYFSGKHDLDWQKAKSLGFQRHNMIAIEKDRDAFLHLRKKGVPTIFGEAGLVLKWLDPKRVVDVVFFDYCCGLTAESVQALQIAATAEATKNAVMSFNFLRGRDQYSTPLREKLLLPKHRGEAAFQIAMLECCSIFGIDFSDYNQRKEHLMKSKAFRHYFDPYSYKSNHLVFDSVIWHQDFDSCFKECKSTWLPVQFKAKELKIKNRIVATFATRTRKINAFATN